MSLGAKGTGGYDTYDGQQGRLPNGGGAGKERPHQCQVFILDIGKQQQKVTHC